MRSRVVVVAIAAVVAVVAGGLLGLPVRAATSIDDAKAQREQARRNKAAAAAQLNELEVSDEQLAAALADLDEYVLAVTQLVDDARRATSAAEAEVAATEAAIASTEAEIAELRHRATTQAVAAFVQPSDAAAMDVFETGDFSEAARRSVILASMTGRQTDAIDELRAAEEDLAALRVRRDEAAALAAQRQGEVEAQLAAVEAARAEQARVKAALEARIAEIQAEVDAFAAEEANLSALIRRKEQEAAAARARAARPAAGASGSGSTGSGGGATGSGTLSWPLRGAVTSEYGQRWGRMHQGIDIDGNTGDAIAAADGGTVIFAGRQNGYGNVVIISHGGGLSTLYAHMSRIGVSDGDSVSKGQVIGAVGSTGNSTGPHLHFEVRVNGTAKNPRGYL